MPSPACSLLSPALPSELLTYVLSQHRHPATLIICSSKAEFLESLVREIQPDDDEYQAEDSAQNQLKDGSDNILLQSPIYQVSVSRHIRTVYIPTVTHLRAYLTAFSPSDSRVPSPPPADNNKNTNSEDSSQHGGILLLYGFLSLHRSTSEWSVRGLSNSASTLVETGHRISWPVVVVEPSSSSLGDLGPGPGGLDFSHDDETTTTTDTAAAAAPPQLQLRLEDLLSDRVPILGGTGVRRLGFEGMGWVGRTVRVGDVMGRWFRFRRAGWEVERLEEGAARGRVGRRKEGRGVHGEDFGGGSGGGVVVADTTRSAVAVDSYPADEVMAEG